MSDNENKLDPTSVNTGDGATTENKEAQSGTNPEAGNNQQSGQDSNSINDVKRMIENAVKAREAEIAKKFDPIVSENKSLKETVEKLTKEVAKYKELLDKKGEEIGQELNAALKDREAKLAEAQAEIERLREEIISIRRKEALDKAFSKALGNTRRWKNDNAKLMAFRMVTEQLRPEGDGEQWKHETGISLEEFVKLFVSDPTYHFLFDEKASVGYGASPAGDGNEKKSVLDMSFSEVVKSTKNTF